MCVCVCVRACVRACIRTKCISMFLWTGSGTCRMSHWRIMIQKLETSQFVRKFIAFWDFVSCRLVQPVTTLIVRPGRVTVLRSSYCQRQSDFPCHNKELVHDHRASILNQNLPVSMPVFFFLSFFFLFFFPDKTRGRTRSLSLSLCVSLCVSVSLFSLSLSLSLPVSVSPCLCLSPSLSPTPTPLPHPRCVSFSPIPHPPMLIF